MARLIARKMKSVNMAFIAVTRIAWQGNHSLTLWLPKNNMMQFKVLELNRGRVEKLISSQVGANVTIEVKLDNTVSEERSGAAKKGAGQKTAEDPPMVKLFLKEYDGDVIDRIRIKPTRKKN